MEARELIVESLRYIEENLDKQLKLTDIAENVGYSEFYFSRIFKNHMGITVMEYVKKRKLLKASDAIINGDKVIDAAFQNGYLSHGGFTKAFKQEFGFSPAFLRAMMMQINYLGGNTMSHVFMKQTKEHATKEELFEILKEEITENSIDVSLKKLEDTYAFACKAYEGIRRYSGDEYVTHPLNTAIILAEIRNIVEDLKNFDTEQLADIGNEAVIMVKLAERLHNMRTVSFLKERQKEKARETLKLFMPIAGRLGNDKLTAELNDLSLKYM